MPPPQPLGHGVVHLRRRRAQVRADRLRRRLQNRKMVAALMEGVARLLGGQQQAPAGGQGDAARVLARHPPAPDTAPAPPATPRASTAAMAEISSSGTGVALSSRVGKSLAQSRLQLPLRVAGQRRQIDAQHLRPA